MKRKAFIIGAEGSGSTYLPGVSCDLRNYKDFLSSPAGGAWLSSEILILDKPSISDLQTNLNKEYDYTIVVFCGHGFYDINTKKTFLEINEKENPIPFYSLNSKASRQLLIIDACREPLNFTKGLLKIAGYRKNPEPMISEQYKRSCRTLYDDLVMKAPVGQSIMYSCSIGESAGDSFQGGVFSSALLLYCGNWWSFEKDDYLDIATNYLSVPDAFSQIRDQFKNEDYPQNPYLENGRRKTSYPFVIA